MLESVMTVHSKNLQFWTNFFDPSISRTPHSTFKKLSNISRLICEYIRYISFLPSVSVTSFVCACVFVSICQPVTESPSLTVCLCTCLSMCQSVSYNQV